ncbi:hypothetical protein VHEMI07085 [[Torrubiella] hemipterigena]|uniref:Uncharacterized protein n=1 Tax=[Torrubiella] hemipterigena TaxID=1531966 RepID=A0A0A1TM90_9HYPO|nr:hypothetical protein VHEMI07085 [[Torrubiella] hemipterigena]
MESEQGGFPWMTPRDVAYRQRWKDDCDREQRTMDDITEKALKEREQLDRASNHLLFGRSPLRDSWYFRQSIYAAAKIDYYSAPYPSSVLPGPEGLQTPALCKYIICDATHPDMDTFDGDAIRAMDDIYQERLRIEESNPKLVKARAAARWDYEEAGMQRAIMTLAIYEKQIEETGTFDAEAAWSQIKPRRPAWLQEMADDYTSVFGFAIFKSSKFMSRPESAYTQWLGAFDSTAPLKDGSLTGICRASDTIFDGFLVRHHGYLQWEKEAANEDDSVSMREKFATLVPSLKSKTSNDTFLVVTDNCVPHSLDNNTLRMTSYVPKKRGENEVLLLEIEPLFVWAYDAHWSPPEAGTACDEDGYEGRIKVDARVILSWFYYARAVMGHTMKDLWRRAQNEPGQIWTAKTSLVNSGLPVALI